MLQEQLEKLGLSKREVFVYLAVEKYGKITPSRVAYETGTNRTSVYLAAKELVKRGLIDEDYGGKILYLVAKPPEAIMDLVESELIELENKKKRATVAIGELLKLPKNKNYSEPKIRFVDEKELENYLYKNVKRWFDETRKYDKCWWGFQDHTFVESFSEWIPSGWKVAPKDCVARVLTNDSSVERALTGKYAPRRNMMFWKESDEFTSTIWVTGDYVTFVVTRQHPFYLVEIHDPLIAANLRQLFKGIWGELL